MTTWIPPHRAARRLGVDLDALDVLVNSGDITRDLIAGDHYSISEESVSAYLERSRIPVGEGPDIGIEVGLDFERSKRDYDNTPNDEGDND